MPISKPTQTRDLYAPNRMLNYDETIRRLRYWASDESNREQEYRTQAIQILADVLWRERDNLYFESRIKPEGAQ